MSDAEDITVKDYIPRIVDSMVDEYLQTFPAVSIEGPKWCGKTTTAMHHASSSFSLADPAGNFRNRELAGIEPSLVLEGPEPHIVDEWQEMPALWDAVRYACDQDPRCGRFLLTGSSTPNPRLRPMHSGAGRIARLRMRSMTLAEQGASDGSVSLRGLFAGESYTASSTLTLNSLALLIVRGGWPAALKQTSRQAALTARSYVDALVEDDVSAVDGSERDPARVRRLLAALGRNESTLASKTTLLRDTADTLTNDRHQPTPLAETTFNRYTAALERMYVIDDIPAWHPAIRSPIRIRSTPKHHLADPSLAAAAIGASVDALRMDPKTMGLLFESLVAHDLMAYARAMDASVMYYRDNSGLEVDLIVETRSGDWGAFEVKLGASQIEDGAANVLRLRHKLTAQGQKPPSVMAVIVGIGGIAHRRDDGVHIIPIDRLVA